jgi:SAM-dependent methyltransferase
MLTADLTLQAIGQALREPAAVNFVRASLQAGYREFFPDQPTDRLVDESLERLALSQAEGVDPQRLLAVAESLVTDTFHAGDGAFWFNRVYRHYKTELKPESEFEQLSRLTPALAAGASVVGRRVLDYGCGSGYLAARLARGGYAVLTTDVLDYRYPEARHLPFVRLAAPTARPFPPDSADTALVQAVLHHIDAPDLPAVLRGLSEMASTVLIKEDTYALPPDLPGLPALLAQQPLLQAFVALPRDTQFQALVLIDFFANVVAQGVIEINLPFGFKPIPEWQTLLAENGLRVARTLLVGFEPGRMHKSCHVWLVCARDEARGARFA